MVKAAEYWNCNDAVIVWNVVPFDLILNPSECELRNSWPKTRVRSSPVVMSRPFCRRMLCDVKVQDSTTSDFHDDKYIHQTERRRCHHEEIGSHDCFGMIANERRPSLRRICRPFRALRHVTPYRSR